MVLGYDYKSLTLPREVLPAAETTGVPLAVKCQVTWTIAPGRPAGSVGSNLIRKGGPSGMVAKAERGNLLEWIKENMRHPEQRRFSERVDQPWKPPQGEPGFTSEETINAMVARVGIRVPPEEEEADLVLAEAFREWCRGETLGVAPTTRCACTPAQFQESSFIKLVRDTISLRGNRVQVAMPWKPGYPAALVNNRVQVVKAE